MKTPISRMALIDALKGLASQLIVLHHLAFYGPMSDVASGLAPDLISWLYDYGRMAVQVFLVMAGFLAARGLAPDGVLRAGDPWALISRRYLSLVLPLAAALAFAVLGAVVARALITHDSIPAAPELAQVVAHLLLLHNILDADALSAGVWYVAIDFQLFVLLIAVLALARRIPFRGAGVLLVGALGAISLLWFNRDASFDVWGIYFFGAYALGVFAYWASQRPHAVLWLGGLFALGVCALSLDYRPRIAVALTTALILALANRGTAMGWPASRSLAWLGQISYSVFLIHFPVCLVVNAVVHTLAPESQVINLLGMLAAWSASLLAGMYFYRHVEAPLRGLDWGRALHRRWVFLALTAGLSAGVVIKPML
jgi:peptidoglycan/LPS O-acetylase OafA/YrhL